MAEGVTPRKRTETNVEVLSQGGLDELVISGAVPSLHDDPQTVHALLDRLEMPTGTQARVVVTKVSTVIVR